MGDTENRLDKEREFRDEEDKRKIIADLYDLFVHVTKQHEDDSNLSDTFVLSDLDEKERRFVREQSMVADEWYDFLQNKIEAKKGETFIRKDLIRIARLSTAKDGRIIKAWSEFFTGQRDEEVKKEAGIIDTAMKLFGKKDKKDEV